MADHGGGADLSRHAALPHVAAGGAAGGHVHAEMARSRTAATPSRRGPWPIRSVSRCWSCWRPWRPPSVSPSCCTTCSPCPSTGSRPSSGVLPGRAAARKPPPPAGAGVGRREGADLVLDADRSRQAKHHRRVCLAAARGGRTWSTALLDGARPRRRVPGRSGRDAARLGKRAARRVGRRQRFPRARAASARPALVDGVIGAVVAPGGQLLLVLGITVANGKIVGIDAVADPERLELNST